MAPRVLVTPFTGYLSDRFDRRIVVAAMFAINTDAQRCARHHGARGLAAPVWALVLLAFVNGSARAAMMPASQALIPNLVPRRLLLNGIALNQAAGHGSRLAGPLAAILHRCSRRLGFEASLLPLLRPLLWWGFVQVLRIRTAFDRQDRPRQDPGSEFRSQG